MVLYDFVRVDNMLNSFIEDLPEADKHRGNLIRICYDRHKVIRKLTDMIRPLDTCASDTDSSSSSSHHEDVQRKIKMNWKSWKLTLTVSNRELVNFCAIHDTEGCEAVWARPQDNTYILASSSRKTLDAFAKDNFDVLMYYYSYRLFKDIEPESGPNPVLL